MRFSLSEGAFGVARLMDFQPIYHVQRRDITLAYDIEDMRRLNDSGVFAERVFMMCLNE